MGVVSFNIMHTNDIDKHTINWYTHYNGNKTMNREAIITHFFMFIFGCAMMYMLLNYG